MRPWILSALLFGFPTVLFAGDNWPQFRGANGLGLGSGEPPTSWDVETSANVAWKTAIDGLGHSAPIVWGDRVFLTTAVNSEEDEQAVATGWSGGTGKSADDAGDWTWKVICLQLGTGEILWTKDVRVGQPAIQRHLKASHANCTPATDGTNVVAFFGSEGLYCFNMNGELKWEHDFGKLHSGPYNAKELEWGFASSPIIYGDQVIVQCDCLNTSFIGILDLQTGEEIMRVDRAGEVATWSTPLVVRNQGREQIVCNGYHQMAGYDLKSGEQLWNLSGGGDVPVPTPLFANGLIYLTNGHGRSSMYAVDPNASGDLTPGKDSEEEDAPNEGLKWWQAKEGSYMPTPIIVGELLYTCDDNGRLVVRNATSGELVYRKRVGRSGGTFSASAVSAGGHIYFASELGEVTVIETGAEFNRVAANDMGEPVMATPAIAGERLLIRTFGNLYCLAPKELE